MKKVVDILTALGGVQNVLEIEPCTTRLRAEVNDPLLVDSTALRATGCHGVMMNGKVVQVVIGPEVDLLATELEELMWAARDDSVADKG